MRELKIFLVVVVFTALVYWGVEPYAHSVMEPQVAPANFDFAAEDTTYAKSVVAQKEADLEDAKKANDAKLIESAQKELDKAKESLTKNETLWANVAKIDFAKGDAIKGKEFFQGNCAACHRIDDINDAATGLDASEAYKVVPPDLNASGAIYDEKFLAALIMQPAIALKVDHKFPDNFPMIAYNSETSGDSEEVVNANIANVIAYLKEVSAKFEAKQDADIKASVEKKYSKLEDSAQKTALIKKDIAFEKDKATFVEACGRCHNVRYDNYFVQPKKEDLEKYEEKLKDELGFTPDLSMMIRTRYEANLKEYLGLVPPDLSMMIRARGEEYLHNFINNTQKLIPETAMPRVGLTENAQAKVISYLDQVGDSKKEERGKIGIYIIVFFVILSIFAIGWKRSVWSKLH